MLQRIDMGKTMSRAVNMNGTLYFCGHVARGKDITEQAENLLKRYEELLTANGSDKDHIVFATIYMADMALKPAFNAVWDAWLNPGCAPARVCVGVSLGEGEFLVEVSLITEQVQK